MLPAVWFIFSRKGCDQAAFYLADCGAKLVTPKEEAQIAAALEEFEKSNPDAMRPEAVIPLLMGIASHHAGLLPGWKGLVENLFQRGLLKVVFATETLAPVDQWRGMAALIRQKIGPWSRTCPLLDLLPYYHAHRCPCHA